jgi:hypothetical protein
MSLPVLRTPARTLPAPRPCGRPRLHECARSLQGTRGRMLFDARGWWRPHLFALAHDISAVANPKRRDGRALVQNNSEIRWQRPGGHSIVSERISRGPPLPPLPPCPPSDLRAASQRESATSSTRSTIVLLFGFIAALVADLIGRSTRWRSCRQHPTLPAQEPARSSWRAQQSSSLSPSSLNYARLQFGSVKQSSQRPYNSSSFLLQNGVPSIHFSFSIHSAVAPRDVLGWRYDLNMDTCLPEQDLSCFLTGSRLRCVFCSRFRRALTTAMRKMRRFALEVRSLVSCSHWSAAYRASVH